jgi:hypothetical protein
MNDEFRLELKALLKKHNAFICFSVGECSDTHGLYDEKMVIGQTIPGTLQEIDLFEVDGWSIGSNDL